MEAKNKSNNLGGYIDSNEDNLLDNLLIHFSDDNELAIAHAPQVRTKLSFIHLSFNLIL